MTHFYVKGEDLGRLLRLGRPLLGLARVVRRERLLGDLLEELLREGAEQRPGQVQRLEDRPVLVRPLRDELRLEAVQEAQVEVVVQTQRLLADDGRPRQFRGKVGSDGFEKVLIGTRGARETFLQGRKGRAAKNSVLTSGAKQLKC